MYVTCPSVLNCVFSFTALMWMAVMYLVQTLLKFLEIVGCYRFVQTQSGKINTSLKRDFLTALDFSCSQSKAASAASENHECSWLVVSLLHSSPSYLPHIITFSHFTNRLFGPSDGKDLSDKVAELKHAHRAVSEQNSSLMRTVTQCEDVNLQLTLEITELQAKLARWRITPLYQHNI